LVIFYILPSYFYFLKSTIDYKIFFTSFHLIKKSQFPNKIANQTHTLIDSWTHRWIDNPKTKYSLKDISILFAS